MKILISGIILLYFTGISYSQTNTKYEFLGKVNSNLPAYGFNFQKMGKDKYDLKIYRSDNDSLIQSFNNIDIDLPYDPSINSLMDVNFDGYKDVCFVAGLGENGKNQGDEIFLFNPQTEKFYYDENFCCLLNIQTNDSLKQLIEYYYTGCLYCVQINTYEIKNNKPSLIERDEQFVDENYNPVRTIQKFKDGKLISEEEVDPME